MLECIVRGLAGDVSNLSVYASDEISSYGLLAGAG